MDISTISKIWGTIRKEGKEEMMSHRESRLQPRVPFDGLLHRKVAQLVCKQNSPDRVEFSCGQLIDEQLVFCIDVGGAEAILLLVPIE